MNNLYYKCNKFYKLAVKNKIASKPIAYSPSSFEEIKNFGLCIFASWIVEKNNKQLNTLISDIQKPESFEGQHDTKKDKIDQYQKILTYLNSIATIDSSLNFSSLPKIFSKTINMNYDDLPSNYPIDELKSVAFKKIDLNINITGEGYSDRYTAGSWDLTKKQMDINLYGTNRSVDSLADVIVRVRDFKDIITHELKHATQDALVGTITGNTTPKTNEMEIISSKISPESKSIMDFRSRGITITDKMINYFPELRNFLNLLGMPGKEINVELLGKKILSITDDSKLRKYEEDMKSFFEYIKSIRYFLEPVEFDTWIESSKAELISKLILTPKYFRKMKLITSDDDYDNLNIIPTKKEFDRFVGNPEPVGGAMNTSSQEYIGTSPFFKALYVFDESRWKKAVEKFYQLINYQ